jgi:hypothetical protein
MSVPLSPERSAARAPVEPCPPVAAVAGGQLGDRHEPRPDHRLHDQLRDALAAPERSGRGVEVDRFTLISPR